MVKPRNLNGQYTQTSPIPHKWLHNTKWKRKLLICNSMKSWGIQWFISGRAHSKMKDNLLNTILTKQHLFECFEIRRKQSTWGWCNLKKTAKDQMRPEGEAIKKTSQKATKTKENSRNLDMSSLCLENVHTYHPGPSQYIKLLITLPRNTEISHSAVFVIHLSCTQNFPILPTTKETYFHYEYMVSWGTPTKKQNTIRK